MQSLEIPIEKIHEIMREMEQLNVNHAREFCGDLGVLTESGWYNSNLVT